MAKDKMKKSKNESENIEDIKDIQRENQNGDTCTGEAADNAANANNKEACDSENDTKKEESDLAAKIAEMETLLAAAKKQTDDTSDKLKLIAAEYDNYRKRTAREKEALYGEALADFAQDLLPIIDSMDRAAAVKPEGEEAKNIQNGVELIHKQLKGVLAKVGITEIEAVGKPFDPELHNAVMHIDDESLETNVVTEEFQKGYKMKERVIRHSMVKVAN